MGDVLMVTVRRATKQRGVWLLVTLGAACGGNAFHVDHDAASGGSGGGAGKPGSAGSAGASSTAGKAAGGSAGAGGATGGGTSPMEGGSAAQAGSPSPSGGEGGSGPEPEPSPISKDQLVYWFKADAGITEASGRIEGWADQSGNAHHAFQGLSNQRPVSTTVDLLPHPVVELDGNTFLQLPPLDAPLDGGLTFFAIAGRSEDSSCAAIVELSNGKEVDDVFFGHGGLTMHFEVADIWFDTNAEVFDLGVMRQVTYKQSGDATTAVAELSANGSFVGSQNVPFPVRKLREQNFIGLTQYDNCSKYIGGIGEIILYSRVLGRDEQRAVEGYLLEKWQLPDDAP